MKELLWLAIAAAGGVAAILGSLMAIGTLLLLTVPPEKIALPDERVIPAWKGRLYLLLVGLLLSSSGLLTLQVLRIMD